MMKKTVVSALIIFAALMTVACSNSTPTLSEKYEGELAGMPVSFSYPDGWSVLEMGGNVLAVTRDDHTGITLASGMPFVPTVENMDVMLYSVYNRYATFMGDLKVIAEPIDITVGGVPARLMVFEGTEVRDEVSIPIHFYLIAGGNETVDFSIEARSYSADWVEVEPSLLGVISSISFS